MTYIVKFEGNVGSDVYFRAASDEKRAYASFSIAESHTKFKEGEPVRDANGKIQRSEAEWSEVKAFGTKAEEIAETVKKGDRYKVTGKVTTEAYLDKAGVPQSKLVIVASNVETVSFEKKSDVLEKELEYYKEHGYFESEENEEAELNDDEDESVLSTFSSLEAEISTSPAYDKYDGNGIEQPAIQAQEQKR